MDRYEAKNLEEALSAACTAKGVTRDELTYYVVEEKAGGLFGLGAKVIIEAFCDKDVRNFIENYLKTFFENIDLPCEIEIEKQDDIYSVNLSAKNNAVLIGKAGQTLQAITSVTKAAASAAFRRHINVLVDVNGYKEERYEKLKSHVNRIAKTVVKTKVSARLGQMSNDERKVIHQYLADFPHVRTESEGDGPNRRMKIIYVD